MRTTSGVIQPLYMVHKLKTICAKLHFASSSFSDWCLEVWGVWGWSLKAIFLGVVRTMFF